MQQGEIGVRNSKPIARRDVVQQLYSLQQRTPTACSRLSLRYAGIFVSMLGAHALTVGRHKQQCLDTCRPCTPSLTCL